MVLSALHDLDMKEDSHTAGHSVRANKTHWYYYSLL